ncbi:MAG: caspase family protein, partial [Gammaproteobacteria bacterium]|nr:caspase family protein [Gammaproteobacteria bacterium]
METCARHTLASSWTRLGVLATMLALLVSAPAGAAGRVALVVGNAAYADAPLRNAVNDARSMARALEGLGFEVISLENAGKSA